MDFAARGFFGLLGFVWLLVGLAAVVGVIRMSYFTLPAILEEMKVIRKKLGDLEERNRTV
ncbi:hypothetical protein [Desulforamulus ruminis]|uniref:Cyclic nucleotide-binding domain-containing protein n=1 Tax=Desulforamulus ruminis (strain ATCC 23193 / DSM 2154 / NCIMB 8452 / DL) TaxID=696281 RepID=F6DTS9_DESRL|nr:hypothetical protein [Desulforamulus ruminis]AEG61253.1 cyclic nucleotide-binding domain-containing protein [Desulforamulus ruminis DSM 2154]